MFKKIGLLCVSLLLVGCTSQIASRHFYQLPDLSNQSAQVKENYKGVIFVEPITLADLLDNSGLVYQINKVEYSIASNNLWAQPLNTQLVMATVHELNNSLPNWLVSSRQLAEPATRITVKGIVTHFNGRFDGMVEITGGWLITYYPNTDGKQTNNSKIIYLPFDILLPQPLSGYGALVNTLAKGWQQNIKNLATTLENLDITVHK